ncbi:MAG: TraR/DksA family transcriptional regulator [Acidimicrobiia bacterium]
MPPGEGEEEKVALNKEDLTAKETLLREEMTAVEKELVELGISSDGNVAVTFDEGFADAAATTSERAKVLSLAEGLQERRNDIKAALVKIEKGTYGRCESCGNQINPDRLEAIPAARQCIDCKQRG